MKLKTSQTVRCSKRFLTAFRALIFLCVSLIFLFSACVALSACKSEQPENQGETPIVTPDGPQNADEEDSSEPDDPENPKDPTDPENPEDPTDPENPEDPTDPENPREEIDYNNLTAEQKSQAVKIVKEKFAVNIGKSLPADHEIIAMDFSHNQLEDSNVEDNTNSVQFLFRYNYENSLQFRLISFKSEKNISLQTIFEEPENIIPSTNKAGTLLMEFAYRNNNEKTSEVLTKLNNDGVINYTAGAEDFEYLVKGGMGISGVAYSAVNLYLINANSITNITLSVRSDGNTTDYIQDYLINGTLNDQYGYNVSSITNYKFTDNALYDYTGLEKEKINEDETSHALTYQGETICYIKQQ